MTRNLSSTRSYLKKLGLTTALVTLLISEAGSQIPCVFGFVLDQNQNPVVDADLDFDNAITGERIDTPGDDTDSDGYYIVCVLPAIYNISFAPPPGTNLLGRQFFDVDLTSGQAMELNVTLDYGVVISGTVTEPSADPIGGVDLDADDLETGARIYTPNDNTDSANGAYWIVVPPADYRLRFQPSAGTRWVGLQLDSVSVPSDKTIDVVLAAGNLLSGIVTDNIGQGLADISIDLRDQDTGEKLYVANNETDTSGAYNVAVLSGLYRLRFEPPLGSRVVGAVVDSFNIENDVIRNQVLESGWLFSAFVHDSTGAPIPGADLDFIQESTGIKIFTPHDKTDSDGLTTVAVLPDTYTVRVQPPPGSFFERTVLTGVSIVSDTSFDFTLHETDRVSLTGRVTDMSGIGLSDIDIYFFSNITGDKVSVSDNHTDSAGYYDLAVPVGIFDAEFSPLRGSRHVGVKMVEITVNTDTTWNDLALDSGFIFTGTVFDGNGLPVEDADFDFISESNGEELFTPHDDTDGDGVALITIPAGNYEIELTPPPDSPFDSQILSGYTVASDTSEAFILKAGSGPLPSNFVLKQNFPNPFNDFTSISYVLFEGVEVELVIFNQLGQRVRRYAYDSQSTGYHLIEWDGKDSRARPVASGIYFYQLRTSLGEQTRRMLLIR